MLANFPHECFGKNWGEFLIEKLNGNNACCSRKERGKVEGSYMRKSIGNDDKIFPNNNDIKLISAHADGGGRKGCFCHVLFLFVFVSLFDHNYWNLRG